MKTDDTTRNRNDDASRSEKASSEQFASGNAPTEALLKGGGAREELFDALDDVAKVMQALRNEPRYAQEADRLDQAGERIIDALVHEFSLKSAQVDSLMRELENVRKAWSAPAREAARDNSRARGDRGNAAVV